MRPYTVIILCTFLLTNCKKWLDVGEPPTSTSAGTVFSTNEGADGAIANIYREFTIASAITNGPLSKLSALYADELAFSARNPDGPDTAFFYNRIQPDNKLLANFWTCLYGAIYKCNIGIEELTKNVQLYPKLRQQLLGEAHFVRAFSYFYLVNFFGEVPMVNTSDYRISSIEPPVSQRVLYAFMTDDLLKAEKLLPDTIPTYDSLYDGNTRAGRWAASALLARVLLYAGEFDKAAQKATEVIRSGQYRLETLTRVFSSQSRETIWQLQPAAGVGSTMEATYYLPLGASPPTFIITPGLLSSFSSGDQRKSQWLGLYRQGNQNLYYPAKFKIRKASLPTEYNIVQRLAELYLIRAEASCHTGLLYGPGSAAEDLSEIRKRSGLPAVAQGLSAAQLLVLVEQERKLEFFTEWGHRFLDLKRMRGRNNPEQSLADELLPLVKPNYDPGKALFPIPAGQLK
ncbi:MAG: RagB/SusD family nutrient uptake outer membrane protein [Candidatus Pseudobacter hemicellulosilyticus]|uniref:RagB/SusD family nutrient uptake outer membrane protein n=1 Tax=Candidatus Pseudobacter hemicellulosilyticus TaxID=3121375 RepID=A0AAJ5WXZ2_9BACT|nr:MAG: RagB/SusD family nutrient uptake outer membrane protein [Pseudobacter sp.]